MTCREFLDFLDDYLSGALAGAGLQEFEYHLSGCPPCVAYMKSYKDAVRLGKAAFPRTEEPVPADVPERLVQAILSAREKGPDSSG